MVSKQAPFSGLLSRGGIARAAQRAHAVTRASASQPSFNFNKAVDKANEVKSLTSIIQLPPSALQLQGLSERDASFAILKIKTVGDLSELKSPSCFSHRCSFLAGGGGLISKGNCSYE
jgi:hypothetical protein